jgi:phenylpropionate dioxygenase-like ring-hydroxylating dioxygenase large terminal subunit
VIIDGSQAKDPIFVNDWHVIARSTDLSEGSVGEAVLLGEALVAWRSRSRAGLGQDLCACGGSEMSLGWVRGGSLCVQRALDILAELHLRSDRMAVAHRR